MAIYPKAKLELIPRHNKIKIARYRRMNLHVAVSEAKSLTGYFSTVGVCSHFYVRKDGTVIQMIDTKYKSSADLQGNDSTISVETQGGVTNVNGEKWTDAQVKALAELWAWARDTHKIPNKIATGTDTIANSTGLSWHRLGIIGNFGNRSGIAKLHYGGAVRYSDVRGKECPGDAKILQIPEIFALANGKKPAPTPAPSKPKPAPTKPKATPSKAYPASDLPITSVHTAASHNAWVALMHAAGYRDKKLGLALQKWLRKLGFYKGNLDGVFGPMSVKALQSFLRTKQAVPGKRGALYTGAVDGRRGPLTIKAEIGYLNQQRKYLI